MSSENRTPRKVLVAEDEPAMLSLVARHMRGLGFNVVEAAEGDAAWDLAQQHHPDLVVLDVMMPGMSGWEICKRLKSDTSEGRPFAKTGVIMLTGIGENLNEMTSPLFAADAWLNKPFEFIELDAKVNETLARYGKGATAPKASQPAEKSAAKPAAKKPATKRAETTAAKKPAAKRAATPAAKPAAKRAVKRAAKPAAKPATKPAAKPSSAKKTASKAAPAKKAPTKRATAKAAPSPTKARRSK